MKWTEADILDQTGRVALVTGANSGLGFETARALAENGATVVLACRNPEKAAAAQERISKAAPGATTEILLADMGDLDSIARAADEFVSGHDRLDLLINNAGVMATPRGKTAQGFETQIGVNHLGHFALTAALLEPVLAAGDGARVVSVSSNAHKMGKMNFDDLMSAEKYGPWRAYSQSKLANLLFTRELNRRFSAAGAAPVAVAAHPGGSRTELGRESPGGLLNRTFELMRPIMDRVASQSAAMGALPTLLAAVGPDVAGNDYYGPDGVGEVKGHPKKVGRTDRAKNDADATRLWEMSTELTGADYSILDAG
jgi:NAD(P)-dependent dehydrogenase (short-subunit alcohol dehydrogenase family)